MLTGNHVHAEFSLEDVDGNEVGGILHAHRIILAKEHGAHEMQAMRGSWGHY